MTELKCPICGEGEYMHAPDGRCDACAEEYGCECGCTPDVILQIVSRHDPHALFEQDDHGHWSVTFTALVDGKEVTLSR